MRFPLRTSLVALALAAGLAPALAATASFENVQFPGTGQPLLVTGSDGTVFTFTAGSSSQFQSFQSSGIGSFPAGSFFLAPGLGNMTPINIGFSSALTSFSIPVSSDRTGDSPYTTTVQFLSGGMVVDTQTKSGNANALPLTFSSIGLFNSVGISTFVADAPFGYTQNLGSITYTTAAAVPGPLAGAGLLPLLGLAAFWLAKRNRRGAEA